MRILAKIFFGLLFLLGASDGLVNLLGNSDYIQGVIADPNSSPSMKMIIALATSHSPLVGLVPILVGSVGLYVLLFGIPGWKSKRESEEERIYERVVETHGQGGSDGIPINTFFKCGGHKLPNHSIRIVSKRLRKIGLSLFPTSQVPRRHHIKFIRRVRKVGRSLNTFQEATDAFEEWEQTKTLRAAWEPQPNPTGFPDLSQPSNERRQRLETAAQLSIQSEKNLQRMRDDVQMVPPPDSNPSMIKERTSIIDIVSRRLNEIEKGVKENLSIIGLSESLGIEPNVLKQTQNRPNPIEHVEPELIDQAYAIDRDLTWPTFRKMGIAVKHLNEGIGRINERPNSVFSHDVLRKIEDVRRLIVVIKSEETAHEQS